jgi:hypothetical protein
MCRLLTWRPTFPLITRPNAHACVRARWFTQGLSPTARAGHPRVGAAGAARNAPRAHLQHERPLHTGGRGPADVIRQAAAANLVNVDWEVPGRRG